MPRNLSKEKAQSLRGYARAGIQDPVGGLLDFGFQIPNFVFGQLPSELAPASQNLRDPSPSSVQNCCNRVVRIDLRSFLEVSFVS